MSWLRTWIHLTALQSRSTCTKRRLPWLRVPWLDDLRHFFSGLRAKQQGKAVTAISSLTKRVWSNKKLTEDNKIQVYRTCVLSTPLYGTESWTLLVWQERKLNIFHVRCLCRMLSITWQEKVSDNIVLVQAARLSDGRIPERSLSLRISSGKAPNCRPQWLRCKDVCKRDLKLLSIDINKWETVDSERSAWRQALQQGLSEFEETLAEQAGTKR